MTVFAPVREARRMFELRYSEQLPLYVDDLTPPWLLNAACLTQPPLGPETAGRVEKPATKEQQ